MPATAAYQHPLAPPTVDSQGVVSVSLLLQNPTRVTRQVLDLTSGRFIADRVFRSGGGVTGGAVIYDVVQAGSLPDYTVRDVEEVTPGAEFPIVSGVVPVPFVALVRKYGGKVFITDEARDRNDVGRFNQEVQKLANTVVRKVNRIALATLTADTNIPTMASISWRTAPNPNGDAVDLSLTPWATFVTVNNRANALELGITYNLAILNPQELLRLQISYGPNLQAMLASAGYSLYSSADVAAGTAWFVSEGDVGQMKVEKAYSTETFREEKTERTWVQGSVRPVHFVDNPEAAVKVTGLAA
jgi:hypothetical protein